MRQTTDLSESLNSEEIISHQRKCGKGVIKCMGMIIFCGFSLSLSFYAGISYSNYLNDNSESL